jgi:hypothetical protein
MASGSDVNGGVDVKNDANGWENSEATSASFNIGYEQIMNSGIPIGDGADLESSV